MVNRQNSFTNGDPPRIVEVESFMSYLLVTICPPAIVRKVTGVDGDGGLVLRSSWRRFTWVVFFWMLFILFLSPSLLIGMEVFTSRNDVPIIVAWLISLTGFSITTAAAVIICLMIFLKWGIEPTNSFIPALSFMVFGSIVSPAVGIIILQQEQSMNVGNAVMAGVAGTLLLTIGPIVSFLSVLSGRH